MTSTNHVGIIGMSTMGGNFALNFASKGYDTAIYNRSWEKTQHVLDKGADRVHGYKTTAEFVESLESPKKIMLLVKSGYPVDAVIKELLPMLSEEDVIIDCGNSNWHDTVRRQEELAGKVGFVGCGISGGADGALHGPSIMPGGDSETLQKIMPYLEKVAAKDFQGHPCVTPVGSGPSGHFVKMVHNGIEYAMMQGLGEIYDMLRSFGHSALEIQEVFRGLNYGNTQSFLMDITLDILGKKDTKGTGYLVDRIKDVAKAKGTGGWTVEAALKYGVAVPNIAAAVIARTQSSRNMSFLKGLDIMDEQQVPKKPHENLKTPLYRTMELMFLTSYLQGLDLIYQANQEENWGVDMKEVIRIWEGGCIIRSQMLGMLNLFWEEDKNWKEKLFKEIHADMDNLRLIMYKGITPKPVIHSTYNYLQSMFSEHLPTNLIQAQRDHFGAHGYARVDVEGLYTGGWNGDIEEF